MNKCIDSIRNHIDCPLSAVIRTVIRVYRTYITSYGRDCEDKGRLATLKASIYNKTTNQVPPRKGFLNSIKWRKETESNALAYRKKGK